MTVTPEQIARYHGSMSDPADQPPEDAPAMHTNAHEATGRYRAIPLLNHPIFHWTIVLPDGSDHSHTATLKAALRVIEQLKREERQARKASQ